MVVLQWEIKTDRYGGGGGGVSSKFRAGYILHKHWICGGEQNEIQ